MFTHDLTDGRSNSHMTVYAPLFSHDATPFTPSRILTTTAAASDYARTVRTAQPGIESEVMQLLPGADAWTSAASGEKPAEVQRRRWQDPQNTNCTRTLNSPAHPLNSQH